MLCIAEHLYNRRDKKRKEKDSVLLINDTHLIYQLPIGVLELYILVGLWYLRYDMVAVSKKIQNEKNINQNGSSTNDQNGHVFKSSCFS